MNIRSDEVRLEQFNNAGIINIEPQYSSEVQCQASNLSHASFKSTLGVLIFFQLYKKTNKFSLNLLLDNKILYDLMAQSIAEAKKLYPNLNILNQKNMRFLIDEIEWIKASKYTDLEEYQDTEDQGMQETMERKQDYNLCCLKMLTWI